VETGTYSSKGSPRVAKLRENSPAPSREDAVFSNHCYVPGITLLFVLRPKLPSDRGMLLPPQGGSERGVQFPLGACNISTSIEVDTFETRAHFTDFDLVVV